MMWSLLLSVALAASGEADAGGSFLPTDGVQPAVWYKVAGPSNAPVVVYLHGGPGYNSYDFERAVGRRLEKKLRMVYMDQRGSGRSADVKDRSVLGMDNLVEDVERLRVVLKASKIGIIGHGFGGMIALKYAAQHPDRVRALVLVETTGDFSAAITYQLKHLAEVAPQAFPNRAEALEKLANGSGPPSERLMQAYELLGPWSAQRYLLFPSPEAQHEHAKVDEESGLVSRNNLLVFNRMQQDGYLDKPQQDVMGPLQVPSVALFAGKRSHAIGADNIEAAGRAWGVGVLWFNNSGHLPYADEPETFANRAIAILGRR